MFKEFKNFALRGNVFDLAIGVVIGTAFNHIITSLTSDVLMPPIGLLLGKVDFSNLYFNLSGVHYDSLAMAKEAGAATINIGIFLNTVIDFIFMAIVLFLVMKPINALAKPRQPAVAPKVKDCPYCLSSIPLKATRCPNCTSQLK